MFSHRLATGIRTGLFTAAATAGVIVGMGLRHGSALAPFEVAGRAVTAAMTGIVVSPASAMIVGLVIHVVWMVVWGVCFSVFATPLRGIALAAAAALFAAMVGFIATRVFPSALGAGVIAAATVPQTVFLLALFAVSLAAGMRLARV